MWRNSYLTTAQIKYLKRQFERERYPVYTEKLQMAKELRITEKQVHIWFENRRALLRREGMALNALFANVAPARSRFTSGCPLLFCSFARVFFLFQRRRRTGDPKSTPTQRRVRSLHTVKALNIEI